MSKRILIIDDEVDFVEIARKRLKSNGFEVLAAYDGMSGLELARKEKPDLIVLDVMLPKMEGFNVCRMLKFDKAYQAIPILLVTAKGQEADFKMGAEVAADGHLGKPFDWDILFKEINRLINT